MTKIVEIAGLYGPVDLPERPYIPFSRLTEAEALAATKIRELEMIAAISRKTGKIKKADKAQRIADELNNVLSHGIHVGGLSRARLPELKRYWRELARKEYPCYLNHIAISGEAASIGNFSPTDAQRAYCEQQARNYANGRALGAGYKGWNGQGAVPVYTLRNIPTATAPNDRFPYREKYQEKLQDCLTTTEMENAVNDKFTEAGANFLYDQIQFDPKLTVQIQIKRNNQKDWISASSGITGLSENVIRQICKNGTIEYVSNEGLPEYADPADFQREFKQVITEGDNIGEIISILAIAIPAFLAVFRVAASAVLSITTESTFAEAYQALQLPGLPSMRPNPNEDWRLPQEVTEEEGLPGGGSGPDNGNQGLLGGLLSDPLSLGLMAAAGYLIFQPQLNSSKNQA